MNWHALIDGREQVPALTPDCVHVWRISTAIKDDLQQFKGILSPEGRARSEKFHFDRDRRPFLICRAALHRLISFYTAKEAAEIQFHYGSHGKPSLVSTQKLDLRFNVSHSGHLALLAFLLNGEIGVDVEFKRADVDFLALAEYSFSRAERAALLACPAADRANLFYEYWTCKEACIKADGRGLSVPLEEFTVAAAEGNTQWREIISSESSRLPTGMRSCILDVGDGYAAAVAANLPSWQVIQRDIDFTKVEKANELKHEASGPDSVPASGECLPATETRMIAHSSETSPASVSEGGRQ